MIEVLDNFKIYFLNIFVIFPFLIAGIFALFHFIKNPIYIRGLTKTYLYFNFIIASILLLSVNHLEYSIFNIDFIYDKISSLFIFLVSVIFLLFVYLSKTFIRKMYRLFYSSFLAILGLLNLFLLTDNIFCAFCLIFWMYLICYLVDESYSKKEARGCLRFNLACDILWFLLSIFLISWDFLRYFVVNNIPLNYSSIAQNLYHINDISIILAFIGFLILIFRFFGFIPFGLKIFSNKQYKNNFIVTFLSSIALLEGAYLTIKTYSNFDYLLYENRLIIAVYLVINLIYYAIYLFEGKNVINFAQNLLKSLIPMGLFSLLAFSDKGLVSFIYYIMSLLISYIFISFIVAILSYKFNTNNFEEFKKIVNSKRTIQFFVFCSFLNMAKVPFLAMFSSTFLVLSVIFCAEFESIFLNYMLYVSFFGMFLVSIAVLNIFYRIMIEPLEKSKNEIEFSNHQIIPLLILSFLVVLIGIFPKYISNHFIQYLNIGHF